MSTDEVDAPIVHGTISVSELFVANINGAAYDGSGGGGGITLEQARQYIIDNPPVKPVFSGGFFENNTLENYNGAVGSGWTGGYKIQYDINDPSAPWNPFVDAGGAIQLDGVDLVDQLNHPNLLWFNNTDVGRVSITDPRVQSEAGLLFPTAAADYFIRYAETRLYWEVPNMTDSLEISSHQIRVRVIAP